MRHFFFFQVIPSSSFFQVKGAKKPLRLGHQPIACLLDLLGLLAVGFFAIGKGNHNFKRKSMELNEF
jgi:hypothetical protein